MFFAFDMDKKQSVLLVFATEGESVALRSAFDWQSESDYLALHTSSHHYKLVHTGIGMVNTAFVLGRLLSQQDFDYVVNAGIAGAIDKELDLGAVVEVAGECFSEMGAEDHLDFLTLDEMGFPLLEDGPIFNRIVNKNRFFSNIPQVKGVTVNTVHGEANSINTLKKRWPDAQVESMEGAAVFLSCKRAKVPFLQIRAISNFVEPRDREAWNIPLALHNLNEFLVRLIQNGFEIVA